LFVSYRYVIDNKQMCYTRQSRTKAGQGSLIINDLHAFSVASSQLLFFNW